MTGMTTEEVTTTEETEEPETEERPTPADMWFKDREEVVFWAGFADDKPEFRDDMDMTDDIAITHEREEREFLCHRCFMICKPELLSPTIDCTCTDCTGEDEHTDYTDRSEPSKGAYL